MGLGAVVMLGMDALSLNSAVKSGDPVDMTIAGIGVLSDTGLLARGLRVPKIPEEPWNERPWAPCPGGSFDPSTPVVTEHGLVPISDIKIGDLVLSGDELTGAQTWGRVEHIFGRMHDSSVHLDLDVGNGKREQIITTMEHPFWIKSSRMDAG